MIVKFAKPGKSFKGVMQYLAHDAGHAETAERVAWTHTINLAHDDIEAATAEMRTTALNADVLKAQHGIGGRQVERPVRHVSLNWHPSEKPDQDAMLGAAQSFLKHMGWDEHQAIVIAHDDKAYRHVHLVVNAIHPETGRKLDDGFERRRAQAWALAYEQDHGKIFCEERIKPAAEREASAPRQAWIAMRDLPAERIADDYLDRHDPRLVMERNEWKLLKDIQKSERIEFFENGKEIYRGINQTIYRQVREEFRQEWASYYAARRDGVDAASLAELRLELIARQRDVMLERRGEATAEQRDLRDLQYRELLDRQKDERAELAARQELGLRSHDLLDRAYPVTFQKPIDREAEIMGGEDGLDRFGVQRGRERHDGDVAPQRSEELVARGNDDETRAPLRDPVSGIAGGLLSIIGQLGESLTGGATKPPPKSAPEVDALERFKVKRGQPPPGDANERAAQDRERAHAERQNWREWHQYEQER
ncbi:MAG: relaxase/mobilization nuclease domain-containing protein [Alphaproteobacteria bacterium]|nr:relaxase/mobilization nuclease domain-containing protein [Alphaproteobacteria bacterium]